MPTTLPRKSIDRTRTNSSELRIHLSGSSLAPSKAGNAVTRSEARSLPFASLDTGASAVGPGAFLSARCAP
jgi:hypothetical protein